MIVNSVIKGFFITPLVIGKIAIVLSVSGFLYQHLGSSNLGSLNFEMPDTLIIVFFSFTLFVVEDASRFLQHWCMHHIPYLWRIHKVHHQAEVLTPLTLYRIHPIEIILSTWRSVLVLGVTTGIFVYLFPGRITAIEILGVDAFGFVFNALGANLRHSHVPVSFGPLNRFFISPLMHQIHHSRLPEHFDKNFGSCFSIWDQLMGSFYVKPVHEKIEFGCQDNCQHTLIELYSEPFIDSGLKK